MSAATRIPAAVEHDGLGKQNAGHADRYPAGAISKGLSATPSVDLKPLASVQLQRAE